MYMKFNIDASSKETPTSQSELIGPSPVAPLTAYPALRLPRSAARTRGIVQVFPGTRKAGANAVIQNPGCHPVLLPVPVDHLQSEQIGEQMTEVRGSFVDNRKLVGG